MSDLEFQGGEGMLSIAYVVGALVLGLSLWAWKRSSFRPAIGALELLRCLIVAGVIFALHQPERVITEPTSRLPKVIVLWDDSESMETRDVLPEGVLSDPLTRAAWLEQNLGLDALRASLDGRFDVESKALSSWQASDPDSGADTGASGETLPDPASTDMASTDMASTDMATPMDSLLEDPALRALVVFGDGDWNTGGSPADVAMKYRIQNIPILTTTVGSRTALPDVEFLNLEPPAFALVGKPLAIPYAIRSAMDRDLRVAVTLEGSEGQLVSEEILLPARSTFEGNLTLTPRTVGKLQLTMSVPVQSGELDESNNLSKAEIDVREESLRVLLVESYPRWEYRYLRNAMVRDPGVEVDCLLLHPDLEAVGQGPHYIDAFPSREELGEYDVVFLGDVGLTSAQCTMIKGLVAEQASGLILMPGIGGNQLSLYGSPLDPLIPVELDEGAPFGHGSRVPARLLLTEAGRRSGLTKLSSDARTNANLWEDLPGFQWHAATLRARAGTTVLAVHNTRDDGFGRIPLLVTKNYGTGKVLFMGTDAAWRWREGVEDKIHYRFWRQVVRWMAYQRKMNAGESMRLFYTPDRPGVRSLTTLYANAMDAAGAPLLDATLTARVEAPSGRISRLEFLADQGDWGLYRSNFRPLEPGNHVITLICRDTQDQLVADLDVAGAALERVGLPARHDVMAELARISRGEVILAQDLPRIEERLLGLETPPEAHIAEQPTRRKIYSSAGLFTKSPAIAITNPSGSIYLRMAALTSSIVAACTCSS